MKLYVVATPIGNLNDLSPRARAALEAADVIAAEDTRVTLKLLAHMGISKSMVSCHKFNEDRRAGELVSRMLAEDITVALVSDAGTPGISDPGRELVEAAWDAGIVVEPVCGPSACVTALSASGFEAGEFAFHGFLPREKKPLRDALARMEKSGIPAHVAYESPRRVVALVGEIAEALPYARLLVCCDMSKKFEKLTRGPCAEVLAKLLADENVEKGEYCLVIDVSGAPPAERETAPLQCELLLLQRMLAGETLAEAARAVGDERPRNEVYRAKLNVARFVEGSDSLGEDN